MRRNQSCGAGNALVALLIIIGDDIAPGHALVGRGEIIEVAAGSVVIIHHRDGVIADKRRLTARLRDIYLRRTVYGLRLFSKIMCGLSTPL